MSDGVLSFEDLEDFFENGFVVDTHTDGSWTFHAEGGDQIVALIGSGFGTDGDFPSDAGTITEVVVSDTGGTIADITGLTVSVADFASEIDLNDDHGGDDGEDGGDDDDDDGGDDGDDIFSGDDNDHLSGTGGDDHIASGGGSDHISGRGGSDTEDGGDGDDDLHGGGGDDDINGDDGDDDLSGNGGDDTLVGGIGADKIRGGAGHDTADGNEGRDHIFGGGGDDDINGGSDDDLLNGGGGADTFTFDDDFGDDKIVKFVAGHDLIDLSGTGLTFEDLEIHKDHGNTVITTAEGTITIDKLSGHLHESDFILA